MSLLVTLVVAAFATHGTFESHTAPELRGEALMHALQKGGYTVLLRHARTDRSYQEPMGTVPALRSEQRNLSDAGVRDARQMGVVLRKFAIPFGEIIASPMFRTRETAEMAAGVPATTMALRVFPSNDEQRALVRSSPKPGTNRLLVTHHFVIETHVPGIRPGDIGESEAAVVKHVDGGIELVGRILLADWARLADGVADVALPAPRRTAAPSTPADTATGPAIPATRAGSLASRYLEAFDSGDTVRMRAFIETSLVPNPDRPTTMRLAAFRASFEQFGPLTVTAVTSSRDDELALAVRGKSGELTLVVRVAPDSPERAASITVGMPGSGHR